MFMSLKQRKGSLSTIFCIKCDSFRKERKEERKEGGRFIERCPPALSKVFYACRNDQKELDGAFSAVEARKLKTGYGSI